LIWKYAPVGVVSPLGVPEVAPVHSMAFCIAVVEL
jgi:hypothetical protein